MTTKNKYDEIINLPHHVSKTRPCMPMSDRAAQFAPFAALTGYDSAIRETGRQTDAKAELDEDALRMLDIEYQHLLNTLNKKPKVNITYFKPDEKKSGGKYISISGIVKKIDEFKHVITMHDGTSIPIDNIIHLDTKTNE